jgi:hypothetical protein
MKTIAMHKATTAQLQICMKRVGLDDNRMWSAYLYGDKPITPTIRKRLITLFAKAGLHRINVTDPNFIHPV